jgi:hypothetical protein
MQRWLMAMSAVGLLTGSVSAQVQIQVQAQPLPAKAAAQVQVLPAQVQVLPAQQIQQIQIQPGGRIIQGGPAFNQRPNLTQADAVFVGRVVAIEPMDVDASPAAGQANVKYRVAVVQVNDKVHGLKKETQTVRVAFVVQGGNNVAPGVGGGGVGGVQIQIQPAFQPAIARRPFPGNFGQVNLTVGQDGMFVVNKHHKENFYLSPTFNNFVTRENNPAFEGELKTAKQLSKVMGNPVAALKADDHNDRFLAAAVLVSKYRVVSNPTGAALKQEPIDAEESKLILKAIAGGDWKVGQFNGPIPSPFELFNQLAINQKDGYNPVNLRTQQDVGQAMQKWLDENSGKYRITRFVVDPNAKGPAIQQPVPGVGVQPGVRPLPPVRIQPLPAPIQDLPVPLPQNK